jgi:hypothetical protein
MRTLRLSQRQLDSLPEYSRSVPTGVYHGKMWKVRTLAGWLVKGYGVHPISEHFCSGLTWIPEIMKRDSEFVEACRISYVEELDAYFQRKVQ